MTKPTMKGERHTAAGSLRAKRFNSDTSFSKRKEEEEEEEEEIPRKVNWPETNSE